MNDLISRQEAVALVRNMYPQMPVMPVNKKWWKEKYKAFIALERMLSDLTSAERKKGKWVQDSIASNIFRCSECGYDAPVDSTAGCEIKSNFCQWCGADMRGEEE